MADDLAKGFFDPCGRRTLDTCSEESYMNCDHPVATSVYEEEIPPVVGLGDCKSTATVTRNERLFTYFVHCSLLSSVDHFEITGSFVTGGGSASTTKRIRGPTFGLTQLTLLSCFYRAEASQPANLVRANNVLSFTTVVSWDAPRE